MKPHPYLRAYMAGIVVPTVFLLLAITVFAIARPSIAVPLERAIVFPMAFVPNLWGGWNMLHLALRRRAHLPLGLHGAVLPLFLAPAGAALASALGVFAIPLTTALAAAPVGMAVYYLVWKHAVGYLNAELGIA